MNATSGERAEAIPGPHRGPLALVGREAEDPVAGEGRQQLLGHGRRVVGAAVVDHHQFGSFEVDRARRDRGVEPLHAGGQTVVLVVGGDHDGEVDAQLPA